MTENISSIFKQIREQAESIATIAQEHSVSTEEQNSSIENLYELVQHISNSSRRLQESIDNG